MLLGALCWSVCCSGRQAYHRAILLNSSHLTQVKSRLSHGKQLGQSCCVFVTVACQPRLERLICVQAPRQSFCIRCLSVPGPSFCLRCLPCTWSIILHVEPLMYLVNLLACDVSHVPDQAFAYSVPHAPGQSFCMWCPSRTGSVILHVVSLTYPVNRFACDVPQVPGQSFCM